MTQHDMENINIFYGCVCVCLNKYIKKRVGGEYKGRKTINDKIYPGGSMEASTASVSS
jgi:hypothetical protein